MYTLIRENLPALRFRTSQALPRTRRTVGATVILLGFTSLITDISSEMVSAILPVYLIYYASLTPLQFGIIDGLYQGLSAPLRIAGGLIADRTRRHKEVATFGYAISAVCKLGILLAGTAWLLLSGILLVDRAGKGLRTSPRDALISYSSTSGSLGFAFGVHRAMDTVGALIGPLLAFFLLELSPGAFRTIFFLSFCIALIGVSVITLFVKNQELPADEPLPPPPSLQETVRLLARPGLAKLVLVAGGLALFTMSDGFLYLVLQRNLDFDIGFFPLLYVGTACVYMTLAVPVGLLADRFGRARVMLSGYVALLLVYSALLRPPGGPAEVGIYLLLFGGFYAATDGVLMALAASRLPEEVRASGFALLTTVTNLARLAGSILFGAVWTWKGADNATAVLLAGLLVTTLAAVVFLAREDRRSYAGSSAV
jgi:MFS family permease